MKNALFLILSLCSLISVAQNLNTVLSLEKNEEKEFLMAANTGDQIDLKIIKNSGPKISEILFYSYPNELISSEKKIKKFNQSITIAKKGIYKIVIRNTEKKKLQCQVIASVNTQYPQPLTIRYKTQRDTTYGFKVSQYRKLEQEKTVTIQNEKFYLNSRSNALVKGGKNRIVFPINLPKNTVEWYYVFSASRSEDDIKSTLSTFNLAASLTQYIEQDGSLQNAVSNLTAPPGAHISDIYVFNEENAKLFLDKKKYNYQITASRENYKSGIVRIKGKKNYPLFLGVNNPDNIYGIHVIINVVAIVKSEEIIEEMVNIPIITSYSVPFIE